MRIQGWSIDGFGHFRDYEIDDLPDGLVVLYGENEAGKSTLLAFLRGVLFGFPSRRGSESQYEPTQGGRHGGRIVLGAEDGRWIVDREVGRRGPTVTSPVGPADEDALRRLLGGADATLFKNVFAFGLQELQALNSLSDDAVRSRIFAAGLVGAGRSAREVVRTLSGQAEAIFTSTRAHSKEIPRLQRELRDCEAELRQARADLGRHGQLLQDEARSAREVDELAESVRRLRHEDARLHLLIDVWPAWTERTEAEARLAELDPVDDFPPDAAARLERAIAGSQGAQGWEQAARAEWTAIARDRRQLVRTLDVRLRDIRDDVAQRHEQIVLHRAHVGEASTLEAELRSAEAQLSDKLQDLGQEWDETRLAAFDTSLPRQAEVRDWEQQLRSAEAESREAAREAEGAERRLEEAQTELDRRREQLLQLPEVDAARVSTDEAALRRVRANLSDLQAVEAKREAQERIAEDRRRSRESPAAGGGPSWETVARWAGTGAVVSLLAAAILISLGNMLAAGVALACALGAGAATFALRAASRRDHTMRAGAADQRRAQEIELTAIEVFLSELREKESRLREAVQKDTGALGLAVTVTAADIEERARLSAEAREALSRRTGLEDAAHAAEAVVERARAEHARRRSSLSEREVQLRTEGEGWLKWKVDAGLPESLAPAATLDFLREVQEARARLRARDEIVQKLQQLRAQISSWEDQLLRLLDRAGVPAIGRGEALLVALHDLFARCEADAEARARCRTLQKEQHRKKLDFRTALDAAQQAKSTFAVFLSEGGAKDEAGFRRRLDAFQERTHLHARIREMDRQITDRLGADEDGIAVRAELATGRIQAWREARSTIGEDVRTLEAQRDEAIRKNTALQRDRKELEQSADVPRLEIESETLRADLVAAARRWAVVTLARSLVEETLERYMAERQPGVLQVAGRRLAQVTGGKYVGVMQDGDGESFVVLDAAGRAKSPEQLSRGTAEQLYLSLRLALAAEFARHGAALPLVMDDVLVNFDLRRAGAAAAALAEIGTERQVIVFTCHRSTSRLLRRYGASVLTVGASDMIDSRSASLHGQI
jgi:uncharacterized protein YhaN